MQILPLRDRSSMNGKFSTHRDRRPPRARVGAAINQALTNADARSGTLGNLDHDRPSDECAGRNLPTVVTTLAWAAMLALIAWGVVRPKLAHGAYFLGDSDWYIKLGLVAFITTFLAVPGT